MIPPFTYSTSFAFQIEHCPQVSAREEEGPAGQARQAGRAAQEVPEAVGRLRRLREPPQPSLPQGRQARLRVHAHGRGRVRPRQVHARQLHVPHRYLLDRVPGAVAEAQENSSGNQQIHLISVIPLF